jgi:hypothetical protein
MLVSRNKELFIYLEYKNIQRLLKCKQEYACLAYSIFIRSEMIYFFPQPLLVLLCKEKKAGEEKGLPSFSGCKLFLCCNMY